MVFDWVTDCDLCEALVEGHSHLATGHVLVTGTYPVKLRECACGLEFRPYAVFNGTEVNRPLVCSYCFELERWMA